MKKMAVLLTKRLANCFCSVYTNWVEYLIFTDQNHLDHMIRNNLDEDKFLEFVQVDNFIFETDIWYVEGPVKYRSFREMCRKLLNPEKESFNDLKRHLNYTELYKYAKKYRLLIE